MNTEYPMLLKPGRMGPLDLDNRLVMAPMGTLNADENGYVTDRVLKFYIEQALGGFGLIVVECTFVDEVASKGEENSLMLTRADHVTGMARLASAIKDHGVKAVLQLNHIGKQVGMLYKPSWGPSTMTEFTEGGTPFRIHGMTKDEIHAVVVAFGQAAHRAKMAGFDGVEIHGSICHLIAMFCSPYYNHRTDEYGGSTENRVRLYCEIIREIRKQAGDTFPIIARLAGSEYSDDGLTIEEGVAQAKIIEKMRPACFHIVGGDYRNVRCINAQYDKRGDFIPIAKAFKDAGIKTPIILDGGFTTPDLAESALAEGVCDFIGIGRPAIADPNWINKLREGRADDIRPCIRCTKGCVGTIEGFDSAIGLRCSVNPRCNMAGIRELNPVERVKRVGIVGGGPAGMEAAFVLRTRGHEVDLYEKDRLGGTMHRAAFDRELKGDIPRLIDYYVRQMDTLGVNVIEREATADDMIAGGYDAVIVATGADPLPAKCKGSAAWGERIMSASDYAARAGAGEVELGDTVLIVGACFFMLEMALSILRTGRRVVLSTRRGKDMGFMECGDDNSSPQQQRLKILLEEFEDEGRFTKLLEHTMLRVEGDSTAVLRADNKGRSREEVRLTCDNIIMCRSYHGRPKMYEQIRDAGVRTYLVGDAVLRNRCDDKRVIHDAITDAWGIANNI